MTFVAGAIKQLTNFNYFETYDQFHNILRLFDVLLSFLSTISETMRDYYLYLCYIPIYSRVALKIIRKVSKLHRMIVSAQTP